MKKIKISVFAVIAIMLGIAGSAFTNAEQVSERPSSNWYIFDGDPNTLLEVLDHENYVYVPSKPCSGTATICGVKAEGPNTTNANPDKFSSDLKSRLTSVFNSPSSNPYMDIVQEQ